MPIHAVSVEHKFSVREVSLESRVEGRAGWAGAPEMAQRLRPIPVHPEDSSSATDLQWPVTPTLRDFTPSSGLLGHLHTGSVWIHTQTRKQNKKQIF